MSKKVFLVGNPNTGKTTLFNVLTHSNEHVGNWHGVTVEEKAKEYKFNGEEIELIDLPGLYSLTNFSYEERVAVDNILANKDAIIVNICDSNNLQRNLYLTLNLLELDANVVLAVNEMDKVYSSFNLALLQNELKIPVVPINAQKKDGLVRLNEEILGYKKQKGNLPYIKSLGISGDNVYEKIKALEGDERYPSKVERVEDVAKARYEFIDELKKKCEFRQIATYGKSKFDKFFMNKFLAFPIFFGLLALVFYLTFFSIGAWLSDGLGFLLENFIGKPIIELCIRVFGEGSWIKGLIETAIIGGVGSVLSFLPQVALLFLFLSILEDSGYLSRVAFAIEDILSKVGLSGKSVYTLLMGFGCSTTAVLTSRNMEDKNSKIKTALLTPYMSCSAKFPIYAVLGGAFFGANNIFVIMGLYLLGVIVAIFLSFIFEKTVLKSKEVFILEFPPYKVPSFKRVLSVLFENVKLFLIRVGSLIISMNIIVWLLSSFSFSLKYVAATDGVSMLETLGKVLAPIFVPLGFGKWGMVSALIAGLVAKEVIVSSIAMFNHVEEGGIASSLKNPLSPVYFDSPAGVISYLVFCLLYFPCLATASVLSKEIGKKWTIIGVAIELVSAYIVSLLIYNLARGFIYFGALKMILGVLTVIAIMVAIIFVCRVVKKPSCRFCRHNCKGCRRNKGQKS